jgi:hypothetical protein
MSSAPDAGVSAEGSGQVQRAAPPKPRKSFLVPIVIIMAIILVVAALAIAFVFVASKKDNSTPEDTFRDYYAAWNDNDPRAAFNETIYSFGDIYDWWLRASDWGYYADNRSITIISLEVAYNESMTDSQRRCVEEIVVGIEYGLNASVENVCVLNASLAVSFTDLWGEYWMNGSLECYSIYVDTKWYMADPAIMAIGWWKQSETPSISLSGTSILNGTRLSIAAVDFPVSWDDLTMSLHDDHNGTGWYLHSSGLDSGSRDEFVFPVTPLGNMIITLTVVDLAGNGQADLGDYFELTSFVYDPFNPRGGFTPGVSYTLFVEDSATGFMAGEVSFIGE